MSTPFHYTCECGYALPIEASSAGTVVPCRCGKQVKVPKLSELKRLSGQQVEPIVGIADYLRTMHLNKQLPPDTHCVCCHVNTADTLDCWVECERAYLQGTDTKQQNTVFLALAALFSFISICMWPLLCLWLLVRVSPQKPLEVEGRDVMVRTPLPICSNCLHTISRDTANIRQLLQLVPLYRQLLKKYPHAQVGAN